MSAPSSLNFTPTHPLGNLKKKNREGVEYSGHHSTSMVNYFQLMCGENIEPNSWQCSRQEQTEDIRRLKVPKGLGADPTLSSRIHFY